MAEAPRLRFGGREVVPSVRRLGEMEEVLLDPGAAQGEPERALYYMYRDLALSQRDREALVARGLRYDITLIPPGVVGREAVKTAGHYHPFVSGTRVSYPEVYEVLGGEALYLVQRPRYSGDHPDYGRLEDVVAVRARPGEKVLIPPNYGHVSVNPGRRVLKMANLVSRDFESLYGPYRERRGAGYSYLADSTWQPNPAYLECPPLRVLDSPRGGLPKGKELYGLFREEPARFDMLTRPQGFLDLWAKALAV